MWYLRIYIYFKKNDGKKKLKTLDHGNEKVPATDNTSVQDDETEKIKESDKLDTHKDKPLSAIPMDNSESTGWLIV